MGLSRERLLFSVYRALLFTIIPEVRSITVKQKNDELIITIFCERELTEDEKDIYYAMGGEISGDFQEINRSKVLFIITDEEYDVVGIDGELVYARYEE